MRTEDFIKKLQAERKMLNNEVLSEQGLARLQEELLRYQGEHRLVWSHDLIEKIKENPRRPGYTTKIHGLDALTGGFREQQVVTVAAHTGHGKSEFSMFLMGQMEEMSPVMIPIEQSAEELIAQRLEKNYSIPRFLSPEHLADLVTVEWVEQRVVEGIAKHNTKMVVIDHLGYIDNLGENKEQKRENLAYRIALVMKQLKNVAKRWNVVVVILVHISQHDEGKPPSLQDIGNSSDIIKESDTVMLLWRKNALKKKVRIYEDKTLLSVQKNRFYGKNGNVGLLFDTTTGHYSEDNDWVEAMEQAAKQEIEADDALEGF